LRELFSLVILLEDLWELCWRWILSICRTLVCKFLLQLFGA
jgi:hypothetical protein